MKHASWKTIYLLRCCW